MKENIESFLASDVLEKYILGTCSSEEEQMAMHFIESYPEVAQQYDTLQESIEQLAVLHAKQAPQDLKTRILEEVTSTKKYSTPWYKNFAAAAVVLLACTTVFFWYQQHSTSNENNLISSELRKLKMSIEKQNSQLSLMQEELAILNNPDTQKYVLNGNEKARKLQTVAYINPKERRSLINVLDLPDINEEKCFQMWANVEGEMVSLGVLEIANHKLLSVPYRANAISYNITIEPKGGNKKPTIENTVANISVAN
jgi:anti-sigma-K factor RskA